MRIIPAEYVIKRLFQEGYEGVTIRLLKAAAQRIIDNLDKKNDFFSINIAEDNIYNMITYSSEGKGIFLTKDREERMVILHYPKKPYNPEIPTWHSDSSELKKEDLKKLDRISLSGLETAA